MIKQYLQVAPTLLMMATLAGGVAAFVHAVAGEPTSSARAPAAALVAPSSVGQHPAR